MVNQWNQSGAAVGAREGVQAQPVAYENTPARLAFLRKVYALFGGTMAVWAGTAYLAIGSEAVMTQMFKIFGGGFLSLLLIFGGLFLVLRMTATHFPLNVIGLGVFGIVEGFLTAPLIYLAIVSTAPPEVAESAMQGLKSGTAIGLSTEVIGQGSAIIGKAFGLTVAVFGGLTAYALTTKRDFSWMRGALWMGFAVLLGIGILSWIFGIGDSIVAGWGFPLAWVILMGGFTLYDTQNILKRYPVNMAPAAAATLFIDFVIMFKYILMLLMRRD